MTDRPPMSRADLDALDAEADAHQAQADQQRLHEGCRAEIDALRMRILELDGMDLFERIRDVVQTLVSPPTADSTELAQLIAANIRMGAKVLPTASRFVFLDVLAGELDRFADEVREDTHDQEPPQ